MRLLRKLLLVTLATLIAFVLLAELVTSFTREGNAVGFVRDPDLLLVRRPGEGWSWMRGTNRWVRVRINRQHLRGPELPGERDPDEIRVLCVGDSFTYGGGLAEEETWPAILQDLLGPVEQSRVRVLNGGANGWSLPWQRIFVERSFEDIDPDVVILGWNWNDLAGLAFDEDDAEARIIGDGCAICTVGARFDLLRATHLYRFLHQRIHGARTVPTEAQVHRSFEEYRRRIYERVVEPERRIQRHYRERYGTDAPPAEAYRQTEGPRWKEVRQGIEELAGFLGRKGAAFAVAMMPEPTWFGPGEIPAAPRLRAICSDASVPCVDLHPRFLGTEGLGTRAAFRKELWQPYDWTHPSPEGQRIIAEDVHAFLKKEGLLRRREASR